MWRENLHATAMDASAYGSSWKKRREICWIGTKSPLRIKRYELRKGRTGKKGQSSVNAATRLIQAPAKLYSPYGICCFRWMFFTISFGSGWSPTATELMSLIVFLLVLIFPCTMPHIFTQWITKRLMMVSIMSYTRTSSEMCSKNSGYFNVIYSVGVRDRLCKVYFTAAVTLLITCFAETRCEICN